MHANAQNHRRHRQHQHVSGLPNFSPPRQLLNPSPETIVLKLGSDGAMLLDQQNHPTIFESFKIKVVDTTAAGALACTKLGAQPSLPTRAVVETLVQKKKN